MWLSRLGRTLAFVTGASVAGLALAFVIVALRPDIVRRDVAAAQPPATVAPPVPADASVPVTYARAVGRAAPAVVNIYTARSVTERIIPSPLDQMYGRLWPRHRRRIEQSLGSGVIVDERGHIVTNHHVVARADLIRVQLADSRVADARVVGQDPETDLAVLKIDLEDLPVMPLGDSGRLKVGDVVLAIGNPIGLSQTVTHGIVSATGRGHLGVAQFEDFIQTDAPINFGNSGGALIDVEGGLVGINTAIVAKNLGVEGIGFAIPVNMVRGVMRDIIEQGRVIRGWIGIEPEDVADFEARQLGLVQGGVVVVALHRESPAIEAGLRPGDLLLEIDGNAVRSAQEAIARIAAHKPGSTISIRGLRGRTPFELQTRVGERPRNG